MTVNNRQIFEKLDPEDQEKVDYFLKLLLEQSKYRKTKAEVLERRMEVQKGEVLTHNEIWSRMNV